LDNRPIGIFDSGLGGLTVLDSLAKKLPYETFIYVGDTARVPYGNRSVEKINLYSNQICEWLKGKDCKIIIVACNTVSSISLKKLKQNFSIPIIGVINAGVKEAINISKNNYIGVLGTIATIDSNEYGKQIKLINSKVKVKSLACPLFVPLVEEGLVSGEIPHKIIKMYLESIKNSQIDTLILGCTHYPLLKKVIQKYLGTEISLVDSGKAIAEEVRIFISKNKLKTKKKHRSFNYFVTDEPENFKKLAEKFLRVKPKVATQIELF
jgi:glutamate racemase